MRDGFNRPHALIRPSQPALAIRPTVPASADRQVFSDCSYGVCSPWLDSHATLTFDTTAPGDWWWRLCNKSINGEDDKCVERLTGDRAHGVKLPPRVERDGRLASSRPRGAYAVPRARGGL
jgi:hypothetical protein